MEQEKLFIEEKEPCPEVDFDFAANRFTLSGTCYPENTTAFFGPILSQLEAHLKKLSGATVAFELKLRYFNSGASRVFARLFDRLEECARIGNTVTVTWFYEDGDENMEELAEDFEEDFEAAIFRIESVENL